MNGRRVNEVAEESLALAGLDRGLAASWPTGLVAHGVRHDSRSVLPGDVFCCCRGDRSDGHRYAASAVKSGAVALVVDHPTGAGVPELVVPDVHRYLPFLAAEFWSHPANDVAVIGVTGTNGKTTTCHLVAEIARHAGQNAEVIGTLSGNRTTPESTDLQERLAGFRTDGVELVAMEVSSHALVQGRVDAMRFRVGAFTNLTPDHLDYHVTMDEYFRAKSMLFEPERIDVAVIDVDTEPGRRLAARTEVAVRPVSLDEAGPIHVVVDRGSFSWRGRRVEVPLGGRFNLRNALLAAEIAVAAGMESDEVVDALAVARPVPGRFERVDAGQQFQLVVDYAHTPDGLEKLLATAREVTRGRVIVVFGCGGDRDTAKRPLMGAVAERGADLVVVTSDNPRSEDPTAIIADVLAGMRCRPAVVEPDRLAAIAAAVDLAEAGDTVLLAGKGHESTQEIAGRFLPFDDVVVATGLLGVGSENRS